MRAGLVGVNVPLKHLARMELRVDCPHGEFAFGKAEYPSVLVERQGIVGRSRKFGLTGLEL